MAASYSISDDELPDLRSIILQPTTAPVPQTRPLRRSPRKAATATIKHDDEKFPKQLVLAATSNQRSVKSPLKSPSKRSSQRSGSQTATTNSVAHDEPLFPQKSAQVLTAVPAEVLRPSNQSRIRVQLNDTNSLLAKFSKLAVENDASGTDVPVIQSAIPKGRESHQKRTTPQISVDKYRTRTVSKPTKTALRSSRFVLDEARCDEDLADSDADEDGEEEETDLSGFIVDDDAELTYNESSEEVDSEEERRSRRKAQRQKPRRRLQRGRRQVEDSEDDVDGDEVLSKALNDMRLGEKCNKDKSRETEVIDLTSPEPNNDNSGKNMFDGPGPSATNLFDKLKVLKLPPPQSGLIPSIPTKASSTLWSFESKEFDEKEHRKENRTAANSKALPSKEDSSKDEIQRQDRFTTPPGTPPRSPSKLKSPSKLLSPSKRGDATQRSPHRQSMDAFWDLNEVNEWHDQFSPRKAPVMSPRKNRLAELGLWSDAEEDSFEAISETSDSLPSPCESPSKSKSRSVSPVKAEKQRVLAEKKTKQLEKKQFDEGKNQMALDLLQALDKNVTGSRISRLSATTGGVQIIWSNTLRSTAGRANWRRTITKPTGSPVKNKSEESAPGTVVQHFANIELATKVIDRPDRLTSTLAHEFCHLANFMVSGVRDQPHGASFQNWARKVTAWMKSQDEVDAWKGVQVTTKHGYVIEWKYLWVCVGRDRNKAMEFLNIDEDEGCGAEYGRHSKSIDVEKSRCGRCQGRLVQVRPKPKPRASPVKKVPVSAVTRKVDKKDSGVSRLEKLLEVVELSD